MISGNERWTLIGMFGVLLLGTVLLRHIIHNLVCLYIAALSWGVAIGCVTKDMIHS